MSAPDGSFFIGSGNEGQVFRVDANGKSSVFFDAEELEVHAIALAPGGGIYAATSPDGKIYRVDAAGKSTVFFDPPDRYIWSLVVDQAGNVFAGTGDKGMIYKIASGRQGRAVLQHQGHARDDARPSIASGGSLAGTESPGRVFQLDAAGKPFVLLDSPYNEIRTLRVDAKGNIYAAAVTGRGAQAPDRAPAQPEPEPAAAADCVGVDRGRVDHHRRRRVRAAQADPGSSTDAARDTRASGTGAVYRIMPDGASDLLWQLREDAPYDMAFESDGSVLVATGNEGKIYRLAGDPMQPTLVARATVQQITALLPDRSGRVLFATSNPGKVLRLSAARADTRHLHLGRAGRPVGGHVGRDQVAGSAPTGTKVEICHAVGQYAHRRRDVERLEQRRTPIRTGTPIVSPRARYLQWRAVLTADREQAPVLTSVTAAYLPRNSRPRVSTRSRFIRRAPCSSVRSRPASRRSPGSKATRPIGAPRCRTRPARRGGGGAADPRSGRRAYQKGLLTFVWRAEDENRDELHVRRALSPRRRDELEAAQTRR